MLRRMSVHAANLVECRQSYVWEDLAAIRYEDGTVISYQLREPRGAVHENAIAKTLHLDHLASMLTCSASQAGLGRQVSLLSRSLALAKEDV